MNTVRARFTRVMEVIVIGLMVALAVVVLVGVTFRKAGAALVWYDEVASILLAWLTYYGAGLAVLRQAHIGFPKLVESASPRLRLYLFCVREVIVVTFFVLVTWAGWRVLVVLQGTSLVSLPWVPAAVAQSVIPLGAILFIAAEALTVSEALSAR